MSEVSGFAGKFEWAHQILPSQANPLLRCCVEGSVAVRTRRPLARSIWATVVLEIA